MIEHANLIAQLPGHIAEQISLVMPDLEECAPHEARVTLEEVKKGGFKAPAVRVVALDFRPRNVMAGPQFLVDLEMVAYVITTSRRSSARETTAMVIAQAISQLAFENNWDEDDVGPAERVTGRNLSSSLTRAAGIGLWAVTWTQPLSLTPHRIEDGVIPSEIYLGRDPHVGSIHEGDYELVSEGSAP